MWQQQSEVDWRRSAAPEIIGEEGKLRKCFSSVEKIDFEGESEAVVHENFQWFMLSSKSWFADGRINLYHDEVATDSLQLSSFRPTEPAAEPDHYRCKSPLFANLDMTHLLSCNYTIFSRDNSDN
jgi:hypothetical protein